MNVLSEAAFTKPRPDCPFPWRWHANDDQSTEIEVTELVAAMVFALQPDYVVETGTCIGLTAYAIGQVLRRSGQGVLATIEPDAQLAAIARARCANLPVSVHQVSSLEFVPERPIDFAFFDSLAGLRAREFERFLPWMHTRTIVAFHDTGPHHPIRERLRPLEDRGLLVSPLYLPTPRGIMFAQVGATRV